VAVFEGGVSVRGVPRGEGEVVTRRAGAARECSAPLNVSSFQTASNREEPLFAGSVGAAGKAGSSTAKIIRVADDLLHSE